MDTNSLPPEEFDEVEQDQPRDEDQQSKQSSHNLPSRPLRQMRSPLSRSGSSAAGSSLRTMASGAQYVVRGGAAVVGFFSSPPGWVVIGIGIVILLLLIILYIFNAPNGDVTVTLNKTAPAEVKNGENIPYKLNVSYTGNPNTIEVIDTIPDNAEFVSAGQNAQTYDAQGKLTTDPKLIKTVKWSVGTGGNSGSSSGSIAVGPDVPPNKDTCNGTYTLNGGQHNGDNFGDPSCSLAKTPRVTYSFQGKTFNGVPQGLIDLLNQLDPQNTGYWIGIASCEAPGFDPNNMTAVAANGSAWGLFQMGARIVGGQESPYGDGDGLNGPYDRGDVNWQNQVSNAVNYNKKINGNWRYWECASTVWGLW